MTESPAKQELPACPVETTLTLISDKWKAPILRDLMNGTLRFGELKKSVGNRRSCPFSSGLWRKAVLFTVRSTQKYRRGWSIR